MKTSEFDFELPQELIAQTPLAKRSASRLLVLHRSTGEIEHRHFYDIVDYLKPGRRSGAQQHARYPGPAVRHERGNRRARRTVAIAAGRRRMGMSGRQRESGQAGHRHLL